LMNGIDFSNVSLWGTDWSDMFGVILFNFAAVIVVPAWLYERKPDVCVHSGMFMFMIMLMIMLKSRYHLLYMHRYIFHQFLPSHPA